MKRSIISEFLRNSVSLKPNTVNLTLAKAKKD